jgi:hypothetical protein
MVFKVPFSSILMGSRAPNGEQSPLQQSKPKLGVAENSMAAGQSSNSVGQIVAGY